ncbi:YqjF family protein [Actomonas aquatica]|uniref:DUF2071 domain-containing protein n=1 Tax=Actomonas aquatica TaxID=2866162 RepID=A0ABZ1C4M4_9BACT|nr:DUF2071 domain-containing protein [Opitutus sp. WL0086]WRQ86669.1 DUF2071 domain-containing protein [Opitutus sp. WL0086]
MLPVLQHADHRPWPLPEVPWAWSQTWSDLAFAHYRVPRDELRPLIPEGLRLQEFDGSPWVAVVPFQLGNVRRRGLPWLPVMPSFPELNLRTYVETDGKPGVWFFSLDAQSWPIVLGGRLRFHLPYHHARIDFFETSQGFAFHSTRLGGRVRFSGIFRATGDSFIADPGSFEHWATERYCLYTRNGRGEIVRAEVHHPPWPLQEATIEIQHNDLFTAAGLTPPKEPPRCHFSTGVDVIAYPPTLLGALARAKDDLTAGELAPDPAR